MKAGKVDPQILNSLLDKLKTRSSDVLIGPAFGVDAAVLKIGDTLVSVTSDPITFTSKDNVYYLFSCNINDLISMGAKPAFLGVNVLLSEDVTEEELKRLFEEFATYSEKFGISVITGHTEVTPGLKNTILSGFMMGRVIKEVNPYKIHIGDAIIQIKGVAIEGTSILSREKEKELKKRFGEDFINRCKNFLYDPGICLYDVGLYLLENFDIHALHDPTEGGILSALYEVLVAANVGAYIDADEIFVYEETKMICDYFHIDPLGLISSGCILAFAEKEEAKKICESLKERGIFARGVGEVKEEKDGIFIKRKGELKELRPYERDQILEVLE